MKLLFDENLSRRLVALLADMYPDSTHVALVALERAGDDVGRVEQALRDGLDEIKRFVADEDASFLALG